MKALLRSWSEPDLKRFLRFVTAMTCLPTDGSKVKISKDHGTSSPGACPYISTARYRMVLTSTSAAAAVGGGWWWGYRRPERVPEVAHVLQPARHAGRHEPGDDGAKVAGMLRLHRRRVWGGLRESERARGRHCGHRIYTPSSAIAYSSLQQARSSEACIHAFCAEDNPASSQC